MDVSIVIPTKNAGKSFDNILKTIFEQKTHYEFEVICVDSGSKDETVSIIKKYPCKLYEINPQDFGHGKTRNYGASKGTGEFIIFITQDALPYNEYWLDNFIKAMKLDEEIAGGFGIHYPYPDCNLIDKGMLIRHFANFGTENKIFSIDDNREKYFNDNGYMQYIVFFSDNNACIRRKFWKEEQYPDVNFAEDQIWMRKMIEKGYKKIYCPFAGVYHSHNFNMKTYQKRYYDEYKALYNTHNYTIANTYIGLVIFFLREVKVDLLFIKNENIFKTKKIKWAFYSIRRNINKSIGGYRGGKYHTWNKIKQNKYDNKYSQQLMEIKS